MSKLKIPNITGHIPTGDYQGIIYKATISSDQKYCWMEIAVDGLDKRLNISIPSSYPLFIDFAQYFVNGNGEIDTDDLVHTVIKFNVVDKEINGKIYSKFSTLDPVLEEGEK